LLLRPQLAVQILALFQTVMQTLQMILIT